MSEFFSHPAFLPALLGFLVGSSLIFFILSNRLSALRTATLAQEKSSAKTIANLQTEVAAVHEELDHLRSTESRLMKRQGELEALSSTEKERQDTTSKLLRQTDVTLRDGLIKLENAVLNAVRKSQPMAASTPITSTQVSQPSPPAPSTTVQDFSKDQTMDFVPLVEGGQETPREESFEGFVAEQPAAKAGSAANDLRAALSGANS